MNTKLTCRYCVKAVLENGGRLTNQQIRELINTRFKCDYYNNTIAKYLSFMQIDGEAMSETVSKGDKHFDEYWLVKEDKSKKIIRSVRSPIEELMDNCLDSLDTYPEESLQYKKIQIQIEQLKRKNERAA